MSNEQASNTFRLSMNLITGGIAILTAFIGGVAWGVRLEYKTQENEKYIVKHEAQITALDHESYDLRSSFAVVQNDLKYIKQGIEEIKSSVRK